MQTVNLHAKQFGAGFPLIVLHGLFGMLDNWMTVATTLADDYQIFLLDLRNHGRSPHSSEMDLQLMAADVQVFMEDNWLYEAYLVGHSLGGKVAMQLAIDHPDLIKKLVVVDIAPKEYPPGHDEIFDALQRLDLGQAKSRKDLDEQLAQYLDEVDVRQFLLKNVKRTKEGGFAWRMNLEVIIDQYPELTANVLAEGAFQGPSLFVRGGKSRYILDSDIEAIRQYFPAAQIETVEKAGHWVHAEAPAETTDLLRTFFDAD